MVVKKTKKGRDKAGGFDATPPDDGNMSMDNGKKRLPPSNFSEKGKNGLKRSLDAYFQFLKDSFRRAPREQQVAWIERFSLTVCIGVSVVILQAFYSVLLPPLRVISLPLIIGVAWFVANKLVAPAIFKRLASYMND